MSVRTLKRITTKKKSRPKIKSLKKLKLEVWELCKQITRRRYMLPDRTFRCYTCGSTISDPKDAHTGHFLPSSTCGAYLRHDLRNLRIQDFRCNIHLGGNGAEFYKNLVRDMGQDYVDQLFKDKHKIIKADRYFYLNLLHEYETVLSTMPIDK